MACSEAPKQWKIPLSVLVVIHTAELQILLIKRKDMLTWQSVTGSKDDWHEPWEETAKREVREETGIDVDAMGLNLRDWQQEVTYPIHTAYRHRYGPGVTQNTERRFSLQVPHNTPIVLHAAEHVEHLWVAQDLASQMVFSATNALAIRELVHGC